MEKFTPKQIKNWKAFEKVRESGRFNMIDPRAASAARLSKDEHLFVIEHYEALEAAAGGSQ